LSNINRIYAKQSQVFHVFDFFRNLSLQVILLLVNVVVFYNTFRGNLTIGEMVLIIQLVLQARRPLFAMSFILTRIQSAESGSKEFFEILGLESNEEFVRSHKAKRVEHPVVAFKNVSFSYETSKQVLKQINLQFSYPEKVALVGHSGVGKSTLINLILKLYEPTKGRLTLNGKTYDEWGHQMIRDNVGLVFQDNELFSTTIRDNVAYGTKASDRKVIAALKQANAYAFVKQLPKGLDSEVGERGVRLSGGQKQRIQIARAILKDAPILILDEATSSLDSQSEQEVQTALEELMKNRLVIIIAHRFSTIQSVDRVVVLHKGNVVDSGTPRELARRDGVYSSLLKYQVEGNMKLLEEFEIS
jgi:ATP-binding cassette subfamily B protein